MTDALAQSGPLTAIGVDLGGTKMLVGAVRVAGSPEPEPEILFSDEAPSQGLSSDQLLDQIAERVSSALERCPEATAVGLGIPCTIDRARGLAIAAVNLPIVNVPIRDEIAARVGAPIFIDNDANVAAIAEHRFGAARGTSNAVMLTIGTGIGGGLILGGQPYRGSSGAGSELGHMVVDLDGPRCQGSCRNYGCLETMASGTAIGREGDLAAETHPGSALGQAKAAGTTIDGRVVTEAAQAGDQVAIDVLTLVGSHLGAGLSGFANIFEPDVFVLGGGAMASGDLILGPAREQLRARALPPMDETPVLEAKLGPEAGMVGAAAMALTEQGNL